MKAAPHPNKKHWIILGIAIVFGLLLPAAFLLPDDAPADELESAEATDTTTPDRDGAAVDPGPAETPATADYGGMLLRMVLSLAVVCLLAYVALKWGLGRLYGDSQSDDQMEVISRLRLAPKREILITRVGPRYLIVGSTETELNILGELTPNEVEMSSEDQDS